MGESSQLVPGARYLTLILCTLVEVPFPCTHRPSSPVPFPSPGPPIFLSSIFASPILLVTTISPSFPPSRSFLSLSHSLETSLFGLLGTRHSFRDHYFLSGSTIPWLDQNIRDQNLHTPFLLSQGTGRHSLLRTQLILYFSELTAALTPSSFRRYWAICSTRYLIHTRSASPCEQYCDSIFLFTEASTTQFSISVLSCHLRRISHPGDYNFDNGHRGRPNGFGRAHPYPFGWYPQLDWWSSLRSDSHINDFDQQQTDSFTFGE